MSAARVKVPCPDCGREIGKNNLKRHRATHGAPSTKGSGKARKGRSAQGSQMARSKVVGAYLEQLDVLSEQRSQGRAGRRGAPLGRLEGFPNWSEDPDEIERAADAIGERALEVSSYVKALELQQRVLELRAIAVELRESPGDVLEAQFVEVAAAWASERGISYDAFRVMGVPARVLREAGVQR
jgi:hypothetical protein